MKKRWLRDFIQDIVQNLMQYKGRSVIVKTSVFALLVMLLPFLIVTSMVKMKMSSIVREEIKVANERTLDTIGTSLDNVIDKMFSLSVHLIDNISLASFYLMDWEYSLKEYGEGLEEKVSLNLLLEEYIDSIYIYVSGKEQILSAERGIDNMRTLKLEEMADTSWKHWYDQYATASNVVFCSRQKKDMYPNLMTIIRPVRVTQNELAGAVIVNIDIRKLSQYLGIYELDEMKFYMMSRDGVLCYSNQENLFEEVEAQSRLGAFLYDEQGELKKATQKEGVNYDIVGTVSKKYRFQYVLCSSNTDYENKIQSVDIFVEQVIVLLSVLGIVLSGIMALRFFFPIQKIINEVGGLEAETEDATEETGKEASKDERDRSDNEFRYIERKIRQAKRREGRQQRETEEWLRKLKNAQLLALQSQINPHYLYNSLETISSMAVAQAGYDNKVSDMITDLADFFRIGMKKDNYLVSIAEEIEHARLYLQIIEVRYAETIQVSWEIDEHILDCKIISLTLQPLIENAIQHGLRKKRYQGHVTITGKQLDEIICLTVEDDGVGMEQSDCIALNEELLNRYEKVCDHVGIRNVNQRIKILFGEDYGICVNGKEEGGLSVRVLLPVLL